jgi:glutamine amidotransferase
MNILIIDYGMGNLGSVKRAFEECGATAVISSDPRDLNLADHIVLPGVGAFADGMANLNQRGWVAPLLQATRDEGIPLLGICLGMQLLASKGYENGEIDGLGLVPGEVRILEPGSIAEKVPHVGWNEVNQARPNALFTDIRSGTDFYFVHSYHFVAQNSDVILARTPYCGSFISALCSDNIYGVQFHPEKSSRPGFQLIRNFIGM